MLLSPVGTNVPANYIEAVNCRLLKLFLVGVLWRASVSSLPYYEKVELVPHGDTALAMLSAKDPGKPNAAAESRRLLRGI